MKGHFYSRKDYTKLHFIMIFKNLKDNSIIVIAFFMEEKNLNFL